jgi:hypothetical protein
VLLPLYSNGWDVDFGEGYNLKVDEFELITMS